MEREEILKIAKEKGIWGYFGCDQSNAYLIGLIESFANAIAAHEREEIADMVGKKLEETVMSKYATVEDCKSHRMLLAECISAIRARGNK